MDRKRSQLWYHFDVDATSKKAKCHYCASRVSIVGGSSGNLSRHLKTKHPTVPVARAPSSPTSAAASDSGPDLRLKNPQEATGSSSSSASLLNPPTNFLCLSSLSVPSSSGGKVQGQASITNFIEVVKPLPLRKSRLLDEQLVRMISKGFHPFKIVEEPEFKKFVAMLNPSYQLPSRKTVSNSLVPSLFLQIKTRVQQKLNLASAVCLTTDGWTSLNNTSYLALTTHYLLQNADLLIITSSVLTCTEFSKKHTADNISTWLLETVKDWGISHLKISAIVTDNATNMVAAIRLCNCTFF